jgi:hypothetical protein
MLVYFTAVWHNSWSFGVICGRLVWYAFPILVCLIQEKSGNPAEHCGTSGGGCSGGKNLIYLRRPFSYSWSWSPKGLSVYSHPLHKHSHHIFHYAWLGVCARVARWFTFKPKYPNLNKFWRALDSKMMIYLMVVWNILRTFGIFYDHLVHLVFLWYIFSGFGIMYQEKIWQPWSARIGNT